VRLRAPPGLGRQVVDEEDPHRVSSADGDPRDSRGDRQAGSCRCASAGMVRSSSLMSSHSDQLRM
jgi:hypothetical protein